jgi:Pyruvate/2-oxoacid:ferredoxin oxidoreductase delta subunit
MEPGGYLRTVGSTAFEKRAIATVVPVWIPDNCTQCNYCSLVCPHAVIRPFLLDKNDLNNAPKEY